tara:strand:+ start:9345 stop:10412 length:1068 start_codon:yes stop_codon:yes gene_type:complete
MKLPAKLPTKIPTVREINKSKKYFLGISTFSGAGGSCTGHKMAGIDIQYANEFIPAAKEVYELNHNSFCDGSDIRTVKGKDILKRLGIKKGQLPFMDGSPPCASFSTSGKRQEDWGQEKKYSDTKQRTDDLFFEYGRLVSEIEPWVFLAENVSGLIKGAARGYFKEITTSLKQCGRKGYTVQCFRINGSWLGVPQNRERMIFIGVRNDLVKAAGVKPVAPMPLDRQVAVKEVLPHISYIKTKDGDMIKYVPADRPYPTIMASDYNTSHTALFSSGGFVEDKKGTQRKMTVKELKRICTFPDDYEITGSIARKWERLGRSVPPLMMYHITRSVIDDILIPIAKHKNLDYTKGPVHG